MEQLTPELIDRWEDPLWRYLKTADFHPDELDWVRQFFANLHINHNEPPKHRPTPGQVEALIALARLHE